jgi:exosome complex component RRP4
MEVDSVKIPRVIGRNSSMVTMIEKYSRSKLFVGKNGRVYIKEGNIALAVRAILKISKEAHIHGLTDRIQAFLEKESASKPII